MTKDPKLLREEIALKALEHVALDGWQQGSLGLAAEDLGHDHNLAQLMFPEGNQEAIDLVCQHFDRVMVDDFLAKHKNEKSITKRIELMIMCRLRAYQPYKPGIKKTITYLMQPQHALKGQGYLWRSLDAIWSIAGKDVSTDYNYYSKRGLLEFAYLRTVKFWCNDDSADLRATQNFLRGKLQSIVKVFSTAKNIFNKGLSFKMPKFR
jgi:ubiquinone biosynthesis protein COQ9